jgi:hypothetical protein
MILPQRPCNSGKQIFYLSTCQGLRQAQENTGRSGPPHGLYCLGQTAQTTTKLAPKNHEVGTNALTIIGNIIGNATMRTSIGDATVNYSRVDDKGKCKDDQSCRKHF